MRSNHCFRLKWRQGRPDQLTIGCRDWVGKAQAACDNRNLPEAKMTKSALDKIKTGLGES
jgi:hypothetical protein